MKRIVTDQLGRKVVVPAHPQRIVSLVPSLSEYLIDVGAGPRLAGVTAYCSRPADILASRVNVGGTKKFNFDAIRQLQPDLIIANKEENYQSGIEALAAEFPVWVSDINTLDQALDALTRIGDLVACGAAGERLTGRIRESFARLPAPVGECPRVCYLIWRKPWMTVGSQNFIADMLQRAGLHNVFHDHPDRYPAVTPAQIEEAGPDVILLSSEPFPFNETHVEEARQLFPRARVLVVDAEPFSWYGSRLLYSVRAFAALRCRLSGV
ncbi:helical backbone metal receptor [Granulosicoccaceae sp. 1_MG-2023]|nr:helical backbone metal receptor [Granulosicoccaceae sp. 1_MG-2023]